MPMHIPFLSALTSYLQGDGAVILPEIELTLFGLGILLIDFTLGVKERYLNAGLALVGMIFRASGYDLIVMFLGLETMALSFYVLTGFLRREKRSNEASLKYVLLGAFSSGILAYGFSLLYGLSASTNIDTISEMLGRRNAFVSSLLHHPQP